MSCRGGLDVPDGLQQLSLFDAWRAQFESLLKTPPALRVSAPSRFLILDKNALRHGRHSQPLSPQALEDLAAVAVERPDELPLQIGLVVRSI